MVGFVRGALTAIVILGVTWGGVIAYWRSAGTVPDARDIIAYLGLLPVGVFGGGWALRRIALRARDAAVERAAHRAETVPRETVPAEQASAAPLPRPLAVLSASVRLPLGLEPATLLADPLASPRLRPHPRHRDHRGLPVYVAMAADVDAESALAPELDGEQAEHVRRALALLEPVVEDLLLDAAQALPALVRNEGRVVAGLRQTLAEVVERQLSIELLVPGTWAQPLREACAAWLARMAEQHGIDARRFQVQVVAADDAEAVWPRLHRRLDASAQASPGWDLLLACHSAIGTSSLERLEAAGQLRTHASPDGQVPGEAAAGVLLGWPPTQAPLLRAVERVELPGRCTVAARGRLTGTLAGTALERGAIEAARVDLVLSDADLRAMPAAEASAATSLACNELDLSHQYVALGTSTGETGAVQPLAQLALALRHLQAGGDAALLLSVTPSTSRWAAVLDSRSPEQRGPDDDRTPVAAQTEPV